MLTASESATYAKALFARIAACNLEAVERTGDVDPRQAAEILTHWLADQESRPTVILAVADYLCRALDGAVPDPSCWTPPSP